MHDKEITYFSIAIEKVRSEFYVDAINEYAQLIKEFPESELVDDALYNIGLCYFHMNQFDKAIEYYQKVVVDYPDSTISILEGGHEFGKTSAKCHYAMLNCYLALGNISKANEQIEFTKNYPNSYVLINEEKRTFTELAIIDMNKYNL
jgi:tetratricopeptide (TPR) repeat protein